MVGLDSRVVDNDRPLGAPIGVGFGRLCAFLAPGGLRRRSRVGASARIGK